MKRALARLLFFLAIILPALFAAPKCQAQINTDRVMNIGRNALYFNDYV